MARGGDEELEQAGTSQTAAIARVARVHARGEAGRQIPRRRLPREARAVLRSPEQEEALHPPSTIEPDGTRVWRDNKGRYHRDFDLPAVVWPDGTREWWRNGELHRDGGKPAIVQADGACAHWVNGERQDSPQHEPNALR